MLYYLPGSVPYTTATEFGQGTGPILISDLRCSGVESHLLDCSYSPFLHSSCSHYYDVGVVCEGMQYSHLQKFNATPSKILFCNLT